MSDFSDNIERVLHGLDAAEADRLREVWELAGTVDPDGYTRPIDIPRIIRVREYLDAFVEGPQRLPSEGFRRPAPPARASNRVPHVRRTRTLRAVALAAAIVIFSVGLWWLGQPVTFKSAAGETKVIVLSDGSTVQLNSSSTLSHSRAFGVGSMRSVRLNGEGFFDVKASTQPFVVNTFNAQVRVLGTAFNVRARKEELEAGTTVALRSGLVTLRPYLQPDHSVVMSPGDLRRVLGLGNGATVDSVSSSVMDAIAWMRGDFVFKDQPLRVILSDIQRHYDIVLEMEAGLDDARLWNLALRRPPNAESVIHDVAGMTGLRYRQTARGFELFRESSD